MDTTVVLGVIQIIVVVIGFAYTWFRDGRARAWQVADAKTLADNLAKDAKDVALKVNADAVALATSVNHAGATIAANLIAEKLTAKVHASAETLATRVAENNAVAAEAARGAKEAYHEANQINTKITFLQTALLKVTEHIELTRQAAISEERERREQTLFNQRVKAAIDEKLQEMNGPGTRSRRDGKYNKE